MYKCIEKVAFWTKFLKLGYSISVSVETVRSCPAQRWRERRRTRACKVTVITILVFESTKTKKTILARGNFSRAQFCLKIYIGKTAWLGSLISCY